ncbi:MAG TPA: M28 family peptidase, partial [Candidatus Polarisedimenticolia bacterium]|nr:M28 family peptidase [Candidatus Polarisedimenticolia bacterium]
RQLAARPGEASPIPVFGISWRDGARVREALGSPDAPRVTFRLDARQGVGAPQTVEATLAGAGSRRDELVLMCAHGDSDSGGPGADDNASGVAALVEVARALAWAAAENLLPADRPTVRFIVWGAELDSSRSYVASRREELRRVAAVINYDQAGTGAERDALYIEGNDIPFNAPLLRLMERVASDHAGAEGFWREWTTTPALGGTDTDAFLPREHGGHGAVAAPIPATTVFTSAWDAPVRRPQTPGWQSPGWSEPGDLFIDFSAWYHSSGDTPERTTEAEPFNMERCARLAVITILRLMGAPPPERAATRSGRSRRCAWSPSGAGG